MKGALLHAHDNTTHLHVSMAFEEEEEEPVLENHTEEMSRKAILVKRNGHATEKTATATKKMASTPHARCSWWR